MMSPDGTLDEELEILVRRGHTQQAVRKALAALEVARQHEDLDAQGRSHASLLLAYQSRGQHRDALESAQEALRCFTATDNLTGQGVVLSQAAVGLAQIGDAVKAMQLMTRALRVARRAENTELSHRLWNNIVQTQRHLGQHADALASAKHVLDLAESSVECVAVRDARANAAICQLDVATRSLQEGDRELGLEALELGMARFAELVPLADHDDWAHLMPRVAGAAGRAQCAAGQWTAAQQALELGIDLSRRLDRQGDLVELMLQLAEPLRRSGLVGEAFVTLRQVEPLLRFVDSDTSAISYHLELSRVLEAQGDYAGALLHHRAFHDLTMARTQRMTDARAQVLAIRLENEQALHDAEVAKQRADQLKDDVALLAGENERLQTMANNDPLTGLGNRRAFDLRVAQLDRAESDNTALLLMDLDHFKAINDTFGHGMGDQVLQEVAQILRQACRPEDVVCRLGGEEFVVIARDASPAEAAVIGERLRASVAQHDWPRLHPGLRVTTSIGVATGEDSNLYDALEEADRALYSAKALGRNRVTTATLRLTSRPAMMRRTFELTDPSRPASGMPVQRRRSSSVR